MFLLKKFVSFWLKPLPLSLTLLIVGFLLLCSQRRQRLGRWLLGGGVAVLLFFGSNPVSHWLVRPLETVFPAIPEIGVGSALPAALVDCRAVVVLGGGHSDAPGFAAVNKLSASAQARLMEALRLLRALPEEVPLIVCGYGPPGRPSHAETLAEAAVSLGISRERIIPLPLARDTEEEAVHLRGRLAESPFALVTSAWHMRRAAALMRGAGLRPVPCPADFLSKPRVSWEWSELLWDSEALGRSSRAVHERLGYAWSRLRGKLQ